MNKHIRRGRSHRALLISLIVHLCLAMTVTIVIYRKSQKTFEDAVAIEFVDEEKLTKLRRKIKPPPPKRLTLPHTIRSSVERQPQKVQLRASANPINETVRPSMNPLLHSATDDKLNIEDHLPDVTTAAEIASHRETTIPEQVSTRYQTTDGDGVKSTRQRVAGDGSGGLHAIESTGAADVGTVDFDSEKPSTKSDDSTTSDNPFAQALRKIGDHIAATRELDKVNVVFVLDTSASMRDNIQQVAANLYSMTDAYDEINLEYFIGMAEFSVRAAGQEVHMRALMPDVETVRHQMKTVRLSGDEHALNALIETLDFMEFQGDADKHLVLVTDEAATTDLNRAGGLQGMRDKVIESCNIADIHVNVLGHTEDYQQRLATDTGGLWQEIPGGLNQRGSFRSASRRNPEFIRLFRQIATEIRQSSGRLLFSMDLKFQVALNDHGDIPTKKLYRAFEQHGFALAKNWRLSEDAIILVRKKNSLWVINDNANRRVYTIRKMGDKLNVYAGVYPESLQLSESTLARKEGSLWKIHDGVKGRLYSLRQQDEKFNFYTEASPKSAERDTETAADIVIMLDYSRSMGGKSEVVMTGISELIGKLDILPIDYELRLIRFAVAKDAIKSIDGTEVTPVSLNEGQIRTLMEEPFGGDEHLIDAIVEGLPKISFRPDATRIILVLTDEPTTGNYPPEQALEVCQSLGIRAIVVGVDSQHETFQAALVEQTSGVFYRMPKRLAKTYPYQ